MTWGRGHDMGEGVAGWRGVSLGLFGCACYGIVQLVWVWRGVSALWGRVVRLTERGKHGSPDHRGPVGAGSRFLTGCIEPAC